MPVRAFSIEDGNLASKTILTSRTKSSEDIDLSFSATPSGDVFKKTDAAAVKQAVKNLLLTNFSEKPFLPRFGGNLNSLLFALNTDIDDEDLEEQIINNLIIDSFEYLEGAAYDDGLLLAEIRKVANNTDFSECK